LLLASAMCVRAQIISFVNTGLVGNMRPTINEAGQVVYRNSAITAIYLGKPGVPVQMVAATNGPIAGSPPYSFSSLGAGQPLANGSNQVAFWEGGGGGGLFASLNGTLYRVAVKSNQVPGQAAGVLFMTGGGSQIDYLGSGAWAMNSNGIFAFNSELTGTGVNTTNNRVIMKGHPTNLTVIARAGFAAPGFSSGYVFQKDINGAGILGRVYINSSNRMAFIASVCHSNAPNSTGTNSIWFHDDGVGLRSVVTFDGHFPPQTLTGTPAPDTAAGARFTSLYYLDCPLNDTGEIAFYATALNSSFAGTTGIWSGPTNDLHLVISHSMSAPGIGGSVNIGDFNQNYFLLGNTGAVAVVANLNGTGVVNYSNSTALYLGSRTNNVQLIARDGSQPPGCPAGVRFNWGVVNTDLYTPVIFGHNRVAFGAKIAGPGVTSDNNYGLWATDTNGVLQLVFRTGTTSFEVQPGVFRTINAFYYQGGTGQNGRPSSINRKGQLSMDVDMNGDSAYDANYILDLNSIGSGGGSGTSSFGTSLFIPGAGFQLNLNVQVGKSYRLQRNTNLVTTNWVTLTNFTSIGTSVQYLDPSTTFVGSFYRVISP
jgi:hypothetical protein